MSTSVGVTKAGFISPAFKQILDEYKALAQITYGMEVDLSPASPLGQIFTVVAYKEYTMWQVIEQAFYTGYVNYATGENLDKLAALVGIERNPATKSIGTVMFMGVKGVVIPSGFEVTNAGQTLVFKTLKEAKIQEDGKVTVDIVCTTVGANTNVEAGVINRQVSPMGGIWSVENQVPTFNGANIENDTAFRYRIKYYAPLAKDRATVAAIELAIKNVDGVTSAKTKELDTPGKVLAVVLGGPEEDVIAAINHTRGAGITVQLERPSPVAIDVNLSLTKDAATINDILKETIKERISEHFSSKPVGESVTYSEIVELILSTPGVNHLTNLTLNQGATTISSFGQKLDLADMYVPILGTATITIV